MAKRHRRDWRSDLRDHFDGNVAFFSEDGRTEREKAPVWEFLRYLGITIHEDELVVPLKDDDVDVRFREARFQNVERMEPGRRRHEEIRALADRVRNVQDVRALEVPWRDNVPMGVPDLLREVCDVLDKKSRKTANRGSLDALVYVNLRNRYLYPAPDLIDDDVSAVAHLGWRSVSVLWPPYALVLCGNPTAPGFLRANAGRVIRWGDIPWESGALPTAATSITDIGWASLTTAALGYFALGSLVLAARALRDLFTALGGWLARETWVVEAESSATNRWNVVSTCASVEDATKRLAHLSQRFGGVAVFAHRRWRIREVTTGEVIPGEAVGS